MGEVRNCKRCGKEFEPKMCRQIFCCEECKDRFYYEERWSHRRVICKGCGREFSPEVGQNAVKYCPECAKALGKIRKRFCVVCGKQIVSSYARYCSDECKKEARRRADKALRERLAEEKALSTALSTEDKSREHRETLLSTGKDLATMAREALEHGMTYGKYIEMLEKRLEHGV